MLPRNSTCAWQSAFCGQKLITESLSLDFEPVLHALEVLLFGFCKDAFIVGLLVVSIWKMIRASLWAAAVIAFGAPSLARSRR